MKRHLQTLFLALTVATLAVAVAGGCSATGTPTAQPSVPAQPSASVVGAPPTPGGTASPVPTVEPLESGGTTAGGDIPDNAVFLPYSDQPHAFTIQYVVGWQVTPASDGVVIRDKDSSETVQVVAMPSDIPSYISSTDLPALQSLPGFQLDHQDTVKVNGQQIDHIVYHAPSPPDPVTGKEVPSTIDRYYVGGPNGLAIVSLSTPDGVDNVDAFRTMIESFSWS
ncbi:MAG: hypothetical protein ABI744_03080 [Chloroflexota bacterium]